MNGSPTSELVSIVIVNYNGEDFLADCLKSVYVQEYQNIEVIVVDNASKDDSVKVVKEHFPNVEIILNKKNVGFAEGCNEGVKAAKGEYVVLLNNDTVVDKLWLIKLREMLERPGIEVVTSKVITNGVPEKYYEMNGTINYLGYNIMRAFKDLSQIFFAGGASLIFRKKKCPHPFLKKYFLYSEDVYLSWLMRLQGFDVAMAQDSIVYHRGSATTNRQATAFSTFYQERNRILNCLLFYELRTLILLIPYFISDCIAKIMLSIFGNRKSLIGIIRAYWWIVNHPKWIKEKRRKCQSVRKVPDREIMKLMSYKVIDSETVSARFLNFLSKLYANIVGLKYHA